MILIISKGEDRLTINENNAVFPDDFDLLNKNLLFKFIVTRNILFFENYEIKKSFTQAYETFQVRVVLHIINSTTHRFGGLLRNTLFDQKTLRFLKPDFVVSVNYILRSADLE